VRVGHARRPARVDAEILQNGAEVAAGVVSGALNIGFSSPSHLTSRTASSIETNADTVRRFARAMNRFLRYARPTPKRSGADRSDLHEDHGGGGAAAWSCRIGAPT
jgi:hypothetical protein